MDKLWHTLTQTYHQFIVKFVPSICMIWTWIKKVSKTVLSLVLSLYQVVLSYLISCYPMVRAIGVCLSQRFSKNRMTRAKVPDMQVDELQLWNCFSYWPSVHSFDWLAGVDGKYLGKDKKFYHGQYLFTVDWAHPDTNILNVEHSEIPQEHKCAHILALDNGNYAAQPNNRILWHVNSYTTDNSWPDYKVQNTVWDCEGSDWVTEDSDKMFYGIEKTKND
jgi:hypothetical protein